MRAAPKSADDRRQQILDVAGPLLARYGVDVSTRRIAQEAGIAEGTLFRVFATKRELIRAVVAAQFDPSVLTAQVDAIDPALPLRDRIVLAFQALRASGERVRTMMVILRDRAPHELLWDDLTRGGGDDSGGVRPWSRWESVPRPDGSMVAGNLTRSRSDESSTGATGVPESVPRPGGPFAPGCDPHGQGGLTWRQQQIHEAVVRILAPDADSLPHGLEASAAFIAMVALASVIPPTTQPALSVPLLERLLTTALLFPGPGQDNPTKEEM